MSTLADAFLADLEELNDHEEGEDDQQPRGGNEGEEEDEEAEEEDEEMQEGEDAGVEEVSEEEEEAEQAAEPTKALSAEDIKNARVWTVAKLHQSKKLKRLLETIDELDKKERAGGISGPLEEDPEYQVIVDCNQLSLEIDNEISAIHKFIRDRYAAKFPELESLVVNPLDYARVVKAIGNEMDMTLIDLTGVLPSATIMVVSVTGSTTNGQPLPDSVLANILEACDEMLTLDADKRKIVSYVESRMSFIAPNLSAIVGSSIAAKMIAAAGGLTSMSKIPSCNLQVLGSKKKVLAGLSSASTNPHAGFIYFCEIIQNTPPALRSKAAHLVAGKCTLAARIDSFHESSGGESGRAFRAEIEKRIEKLQEPPPPKQPKPLPIPDDKPRQKRAGRRVRRAKEKFVMTELRKNQNRMMFGVQEETYGASGKGFGMLGQSDSNKLRVKAADNNHLLKVAKKQKTEKKYGSSGTTSGLASSLAFTPVQGLELVAPQQAYQRESQSKYFSPISGFHSLIKK